MSLADLRIETERLVLRLPQAGDFERYAELQADEEAARWIGGQIGKFTADNPVNTFLLSAAIPIAIGIALLVFAKVVNRLMDPVH